MPPPDTAIDAAELRQGCQALGLSPTAEQFQHLLDYAALLQRWNSIYNLTAVRDARGILTQHLLDCLAVVKPLARVLAPRSRVLDVGSGGGLPGVVLAVMFGDADVTCIDAVGKKAAFLRQVAASLQLRNLHPVQGRVEHLKGEGFDLITSRAFASLPDFVRWTSACLGPRGQWVAMKGHPPVDEVAHLPEEVEMFHVEPLAVPGLAAERCLVWMKPRDRG